MPQVGGAARVARVVRVAAFTQQERAVDMQQNSPLNVYGALLSEGGYSNDPRDPGGPTNWGITLADARVHWKPDAAADVRTMPRSVAEAIYKAEYWDI